MTGAITLTPAQYDIVWDDLRLGEQPYPVAVRSHGRTMEERALIRNRVYGELTARRLADGPRVTSGLADMLGLLATAPASVDMIWLPHRDATRVRNALAVAAGDHGLLAELTDDGLVLRTVPGSSIVAALVGLLPQVPAAPGPSITLPIEELVPAGAHHDGADPDDGGSIYEPSGRGSSAASRQIRSLEALFAAPRLRGGQIVANTRDRHGRRHRSHPLEWFDTENGRCMAQTGTGADGRQHLLMTPADTAKVVRRVQGMLDELTRVR
jgi:EspG family